MLLLKHTVTHFCVIAGFYRRLHLHHGKPIFWCSLNYLPASYVTSITYHLQVSLLLTLSNLLPRFNLSSYPDPRLRPPALQYSTTTRLQLPISQLNMAPAFSFNTCFRPESSWSAGPVDPAVIATHGVGSEDSDLLPFGSLICHSEALGYCSQDDEYKYSEHHGFLIHDVAFKTLDDLFFPTLTPYNWLYIARRYTDDDKDGHYWQVQLLHRGLPPTSASEVAKIRLLCAPKRISPDLPFSHTEANLKLHLEYILQDPRRDYKYTEQIEGDALIPYSLLEDPTPASSAVLIDYVRARTPVATDLPDQSLVAPETFVGRFEVAFYYKNSLETPAKKLKEPELAGEIIFTLDPRSARLFGRFRMSPDAHATHGLFSMPYPDTILGAARPCSVAIEDKQGDWSICHATESGEEGVSGAYIKFYAEDVIELGSAFWGKQQDDSRCVVGVKQKLQSNGEDLGFTSKYYAELEGVHRPDIFRKMWRDVHREYCGDAGCS